MNCAFLNRGTIKADEAGQTVTLWGRGLLTNIGTLSAQSGGTLNLAGKCRTAQGTFQNNGGVINFSGSLDNSNATLTLNATTGLLNLLTGGTISGGTVTASAGGGLVLMKGTDWRPITLDGVTLDTDLTVDNEVELRVLKVQLLRLDF